MAKELANFFYDQLAGKSNGQMAEIPNNPVIYSLLAAHGALDSRKEFAQFLFNVADFLGDEYSSGIEDTAIRNAADAIRDAILHWED